MAYQTRAYPGFRSIKRLGILLLPPGWDVCPSQGYPQYWICWYPFIHLAGERYCGGESLVSCPRTQHNVPSQGSHPDRSIRSRAHWLFILLYLAKKTDILLNTSYQWCSFCHIGFESLFVCSYETESSQVGSDKYTKGDICISVFGLFILFFSSHIAFSFHRSLLLGTYNYLSHSFFTDQSFFSLNLLQIQTTAGISVTTHKHELNERWKKKKLSIFSLPMHVHVDWN